MALIDTAWDEFGIFEEPCSVTAFDMKVQVTKDGRKRGLWICLVDKSLGRVLHSRMIPLGDLINTYGKVDEAALLEWKEIEKLHKVLGEQLKLHREGG